MAPWIDLTIRLEQDPEVEVNPLTGEFSISFPVPEMGESARITLLLPRKLVERANARNRELLTVSK